MKSHEELRSMLPAMAGGDLSKTELALLEQHLAECRECRAELAELQLVLQVMRETPELEPPPWLATRIMAQVREEAASRTGWFARLFLPLKIKLPLEALALVMICATAWYIVQEVERSQQRLQAPPAAEAPAAAPAREADRGTELQAPPTPDPSMPAVPKAEPPSSAAPVRPEAQRTQAAPAFAPPPQKVPEPVEQMERAKSASESVPAPSAVNREQRAGSPSPSADRAMAAKRKAESSGSGTGVTGMQLKRLRLVVDDQTTIAETLEVIVPRLGGAILERRTGSARVRIQEDRLPELVEQLARSGRIAERPVMDTTGDKMLELLIIWQVVK